MIPSTTSEIRKELTGSVDYYGSLLGLYAQSIELTR